MYSEISGLFSSRELVCKSSIIGFTYPICEDVLGGKVLNFRSDARSAEVSAWLAFSVREVPHCRRRFTGFNQQIIFKGCKMEKNIV